MNPLFRFAVWSNVFYVVPLTAALFLGLPFAAFALTVLIIISTAFHATAEKRFSLLDTLAGGTVLALNLVLWYLGGFKIFYFLIICFLFVLAVYIRYWREHGDRESAAHGWWHLCAALATLFCILSYAT